MSKINEAKEYFNSLADKWDSICQHDENKLSAVATLACIKSGDRVLDIACGTGIMFTELLKRDISELVGVDVSDKMIEKARGKFSDNRLTFIADDLFNLDEKNTFDVAIIYSAYPHFEDKKALCEKIHSLLKENGRFIIAHSESKETINNRHEGSAKDVSTLLQSPNIEKQYFTWHFDIDTEVDTNEMYILSGLRK